jgi:hypothetical protein
MVFSANIFVPGPQTFMGVHGDGSIRGDTRGDSSQKISNPISKHSINQKILERLFLRDVT